MTKEAKDTKAVKDGGGKDIDAFARVIFGEAANDSEEGKRAIADCIINRIKHPAYPNTLSGVLTATTGKGKHMCATLDNKSHGERYTAAKKATHSEHWAYLDSVTAAQEASVGVVLAHALRSDRVDTTGGATQYVDGTVEAPSARLDATLDTKKWQVAGSRQVGERVLGVVTKVEKK
ncbi:MAG: hypothetical protein WDW36_006886 [Sanguina aurantia]